MDKETKTNDAVDDELLSSIKALSLFILKVGGRPEEAAKESIEALPNVGFVLADLVKLAKGVESE